MDESVSPALMVYPCAGVAETVARVLQLSDLGSK